MHRNNAAIMSLAITTPRKETVMHTTKDHPQQMKFKGQDSEDFQSALLAYGSVKYLRDGTALVHLAPQHWERMRRDESLEETACGVRILLSEFGSKVAYGHTVVHVKSGESEWSA